MNQTKRVFSGAPWEKTVGYCRAIRKGNTIAVTGTVAINEDGGVFAEGDAYEQAKRCLQIIEKTLLELEAKPSDIMRTRLFVTDIKRWQDFGRAHAEFFANFPPATSMIEVKSLIAPGFLIEIEADALLTH